MNTIKKSKFLLLIAIFLSVSIEAYPQSRSVDFIVYFVKGSVKKLNQAQRYQLKKGDRLFTTDLVDVAANSELILICEKFSSIKITNPVVIKLSALLPKCTDDKSSSFTTAYFHYVWNQLSGNVSADSTENIGGIGRQGRNPDLNFSIDTIYYNSGPIAIKLPEKNGAQIKFYRRPSGGKPTLEFRSENSNIRLDSLFQDLNPGVYYWTISTRNAYNASRYYLHFMSKPDYQNAIDSALNNVTETTPAETGYMAGFILEKAGLLVEAAKFYKQAYLLEPDNIAYKNADMRFEY